MKATVIHPNSIWNGKTGEVLDWDETYVVVGFEAGKKSHTFRRGSVDLED